MCMNVCVWREGLVLVLAGRNEVWKSDWAVLENEKLK